MLINSNIPSLHNGVSQQPAYLRLPSQAQTSENTVASPTDGVGKRPPLQHVGILFDPVDRLDDSQWHMLVHFINRDDQEKYVVFFKQDRVKVHGINGEEYPVLSQLYHYDYITTDNPTRDLRCLTIADTTFVLNKAIKVEMQEDAFSPATRGGAIVWVKAGNYFTTYSVKVNGQEFKWTTPKNDQTNPGDGDIATNTIAKTLSSLMKASLPGDEWTVTYRKGDNVFWIDRPDGADFTVEVTDTNGNRNMSVVKDEVSRFDQLPDTAVNGFICKVAGDVQAAEDDYYVQFLTTAQTTIGPGLWSECAASNILNTLDGRTMPHKLVRKEDDNAGTVTGTPFGIYFEFTKCGWEVRASGDDETNPAPSFVGHTLSDIFLTRNRLGVTSGSNVILSRSGNFFDFFRASARGVVDDDPIDVSSTNPRVLNIRYAVPFNQNTVLFGENTQMILTGGDILSPKTVSILPATNIESDLICAPIAVESNLYFPFRSGDYAGIREYYVVSENQQNNSDDITKHVPKYIPGSVYHLSASATQRAMIALSDSDRGTIWLYQWTWVGNERQQAAWQKWTFGAGATVYGAEFINDTLYFVVGHVDGVFLEKVNFARKADPDANYVTYLDRRLTESQCNRVTYDSHTKETTYWLPFHPESPFVIVTRTDADDESYKPAVFLPIVRTELCEEDTPNPPVDPPVDPPVEVPTVTVQAVVPDTEEGSDVPGKFVITRTGSVENDLQVTVTYSGSATLGTDYELTPAGITVTIPAGSASVEVLVTAYEDDIVEGDETVVLTLNAIGDDYAVGTPSSATVRIIDVTAPSCEVAPVDPDTPVRIRVFGMAEPNTPQPYIADHTIEWTGNLNQAYEFPADPNTTDQTIAVPGIHFVERDGGGNIVNTGTGVTASVSFTIGPPGSYRFSIQSDGTFPGGPVFDTYPEGFENKCEALPNTATYQTITLTGTCVLEQDEDTGGGGGPPAVPAAPTNLTATAVSGSQINLTWTDNSPDETGFRIERSPDGATLWAAVGFVNPDVTSFSDTGLGSAQTYYYRVFAFNAGGDSTATSTANATTLGGGPTDDRIRGYDTGEDRVEGLGAFVDRRWTVNGVSAFVHPTALSPFWLGDEAATHWISHKSWTGDLNETVQTDRTFQTVIKIGTNVTLGPSFTLAGKWAADGTIVDVKVNGVSVTMNLATANDEWTDFTIPYDEFRHGDNTISIKVRNPVGNNNPTGLIVKWITPLSDYARYIEADDDEEVEEISPETTLLSFTPSRDAVSLDCPFKIVVRGDYREKPVYLGQQYRMEYEFTTPYLREVSPIGGIAAITNGRTQVRTMTINHRDTGYYRVEVTPALRSTGTYKFTGRIVGSPVTRIGDVPLDTGSFRVGVGSKNDQVQIVVVNDSILPSFITSASWEGTYTDRSTKI